MEPNDLIKYLVESIKPRKEILKLVYCRGREKGKRIECWIDTEMLASLLSLKERNLINETEGEHPYTMKDGRNYTRCDLWWSNGNNQEHWLEVKTIRLHNDGEGLKKDYMERIEKDLIRAKNAKPPFDFYHLLLIFDDENYSVPNWRKNINEIYGKYRMSIEEGWPFDFDIVPGKDIHAFLHHRSFK